MHLKISSAKWRLFCLGLNVSTLNPLFNVVLQQLSSCLDSNLDCRRYGESLFHLCYPQYCLSIMQINVLIMQICILWHSQKLVSGTKLRVCRLPLTHWGLEIHMNWVIIGLGNSLGWCPALPNVHYCGVIMGAMASRITSLTIVFSTVHSGADQRKHRSSAPLTFKRGIHRWLVNSPHKWPVTRKMFPFDDVIMICWLDVIEMWTETQIVVVGKLVSLCHDDLSRFSEILFPVIQWWPVY